MDTLPPWLADLNDLEGLGRHWIGLICVLVSVVCGAAIGVERERRGKPAGMRTVVLIAVGSTIYTLVSLLFGESKPMADPARLAAQIIPGIGFLGAGAIIQARGTVVGLTTGATIWAVAAVGVTIGSGHVAAGVAFSLIILLTLTLLQHLDWVVTGRCATRRAVVTYRPDSGKTFPRLQQILDEHLIPDRELTHGPADAEPRTLAVTICTRHREHRRILTQLAEVDQVLGLDVES